MAVYGLENLLSKYHHIFGKDVQWKRCKWHAQLCRCTVICLWNSLTPHTCSNNGIEAPIMTVMCPKGIFSPCFQQDYQIHLNCLGRVWYNTSNSTNDCFIVQIYRWTTDNLYDLLSKLVATLDSGCLPFLSPRAWHHKLFALQYTIPVICSLLCWSWKAYQHHTCMQPSVTSAIDFVSLILDNSSNIPQGHTAAKKDSNA